MCKNTNKNEMKIYNKLKQTDIKNKGKNFFNLNSNIPKIHTLTIACSQNLNACKKKSIGGYLIHKS